MLTGSGAGGTPTRFEVDLHRLAGDVVAPRAAEIDREGQYPHDLHAAFADRGLLALSLPPELGGPDPERGPAGVRALTTATRVMAHYSSAAGLMLLLSRLPAAPVLIGGTAEQRRALLPALGRGRTRAAFAMSEPQAGSDVAGLATTAVPTSTGWRLTGRKSWISGAVEANWFVVVATVGDPVQRRTDALRAFVVPADAPGLQVSAVHQRNAVRGVSLGDLTLADVEVGPEALLAGIEGIGSLLRGLATMRPVVAARGLGLAQAALQLAVEHAERRTVGGTPLIRQQGIAWELARAAADVEAAGLLVDRAAELVDAGRTGAQAAGALAVAKLHATESAVRVSGLATQILGAAGTVAGHPAERMYRDARSLTVVEGTSEIQLGIIAQALADRRLWWRPAASGPVDRP